MERNGSIYIINEGKEELFAKVENVEFKEEASPIHKREISFARCLCGSFEAKIYMDRCTRLSLIYGCRITNNWLKMHGGIMTRKTLKERRMSKNWKKMQADLANRKYAI